MLTVRTGIQVPISFLSHTLKLLRETTYSYTFMGHTIYLDLHRTNYMMRNMQSE